VPYPLRVVEVTDPETGDPLVFLFGWSLSNLVALLQFQLFTHRDLWAWLNDPFIGPPVVAKAEQQILADVA
jgi:hypothetical protein